MIVIARLVRIRGGEVRRMRSGVLSKISRRRRAGCRSGRSFWWAGERWVLGVWVSGMMNVWAAVMPSRRAWIQKVQRQVWELTIAEEIIGPA